MLIATCYRKFSREIFGSTAHINKRWRYIVKLKSEAVPSSFTQFISVGALTDMATVKRIRTTKSNNKKAGSTPEAEAVKTDVAKVMTQAVNIQDAIRNRAYELFEERGYQHGYDRDDWLRAESEVLARFGARTA